jgi:hypothetical protein
MTLLQLAAIRTRQAGRPSSILVERGAEVDLHSACGLAMINRIVELVSERPEAVSDQIDTYFPMQLAITAGHASVIQCLAEHGDEP